MDVDWLKASHLQLKPRGRLVAGAVQLRPPQPLLAVRGVPWWTLADEAPHVLDEAVAGGKATDAEGEEDPPTGMGRLGGVLGELLADLTVNLISERGESYMMNRYSYACTDSSRVTRKDRQTDRQTDRKTDRKTDRQTDCLAHLLILH